MTFLAASGDSSGPPSATNSGDYNGSYPAFSPNVVAVGGTTLSLNPDNSYKGEVAWNIITNRAVSAGGISLYEPEPPYQQGVNSTAWRTIPDVSMIAGTDITNPGTVPTTPPTQPLGSGVAVYDSYQNGATNANATPWGKIVGTSLATPAFAGLIAIGDQLRQSVGEAPLDTSQTLNTLYSLPASAFHDITSGNNLVPYFAGPGYDLVTGLALRSPICLCPPSWGRISRASSG